MDNAIIIKKLKAASMLLQECYSAIMQQEGADPSAAPKGRKKSVKVIDIKDLAVMKIERKAQLSKKTINQ